MDDDTCGFGHLDAGGLWFRSLDFALGGHGGIFRLQLPLAATLSSAHCVSMDRLPGRVRSGESNKVSNEWAWFTGNFHYR